MDAGRLSACTIRYAVAIRGRDAWETETFFPGRMLTSGGRRFSTRGVGRRAFFSFHLKADNRLFLRTFDSACGRTETAQPAWTRQREKYSHVEAEPLLHQFRVS